MRHQFQGAAWAIVALACSGPVQTGCCQESPDGAALFKAQCATCHTLNPAEPPRQGPTLAGIYGRKPGTEPGFKYSPGFKDVHFVWDEQHLDAYLANPQAVIPGAVMPYRQSKKQVRQAIIAYLKEQH